MDVFAFFGLFNFAVFTEDSQGRVEDWDGAPPTCGENAIAEMGDLSDEANFFENRGIVALWAVCGPSEDVSQCFASHAGNVKRDKESAPALIAYVNHRFEPALPKIKRMRRKEQGRGAVHVTAVSP